MDLIPLQGIVNEIRNQNNNRVPAFLSELSRGIYTGYSPI